jgi:hypothetical protein
MAKTVMDDKREKISTIHKYYTTIHRESIYKDGKAALE